MCVCVSYPILPMYDAILSTPSQLFRGCLRLIHRVRRLFNREGSVMPMTHDATDVKGVRLAVVALCLAVVSNMPNALATSEGNIGSGVFGATSLCRHRDRR